MRSTIEISSKNSRNHQLNVFACLDLLPSLLGERERESARTHKSVTIIAGWFSFSPWFRDANVLRIGPVSCRLHFGVIFNAVIYADVIIDYGQRARQQAMFNAVPNVHAENRCCSEFFVIFCFLFSAFHSRQTLCRSGDRTVCAGRINKSAFDAKQPCEWSPLCIRDDSNTR